ncbi:MAG: SPOR domain-containing protein [Ignavibacteriae bacterium]|nr:SPOR domain-containing protein [Ignavibacteriota bacterium]
MIKKIIYFVIPVSVIFSFLFYACSSDVYDEDDIVVVRDTITITTDTTIKEQREMEKVRLMLVIQLAAFSSRDHAETFAATAKDKLSREVDIRKAGGVFVVTVGSYSDAKSAEEYLYVVKTKGFDKAFIKNIKFN